MYNWKKWIWPGLITVVVLAAASVWLKVEDVQQDLQAKSLEALSSSHPWASVSLDGRDLTLTGTAPSPEAVEQARELADAAYDVRIVMDQTELLPVADPFVLAVEKKAEAFTLTGSVPSDDLRQTMVSALSASSAQARIDDQMTLARGAGEALPGLVEFGLKQLDALESGKFQISNSEFAIAGRASGFAEYDAINRDLDNAFPAGGTLAGRDILPPVVTPYEWQADFDDGSLALSGFAPNADASSAIASAIAAQLPDATLDNGLQIADGAPAEFKTATDYAAGFLPLLSKGQVRFENNKFYASGVAKSPEAYAQVLDRADNVPEGYEIAENAIQPVGISPYTWSAIREGTSLVMDGYAPSRDARRNLAGAAREAMPQAGIIDNLQIAGGAPSSYENAVAFGLNAIKGLADGSAALDDDTLVISGTAETAESYEEIGDLVASGVEGLTIVNNVAPAAASPFRWSVTSREGEAVVRGFVSSDNARSGILEAVGTALGKTTIDRMRLASGAPEGLDEARNFVLSQVALLAAGEGVILDNQVNISGRAPSDAVKDQISAAVENSLPDGFTGSVNILVPAPEPPPEPEPTPEPEPVVSEPQPEPAPVAEPEVTAEVCQAGIAAAIDNRQIQFETARAVILPASEAVLTSILEAAAKCPSLRILVSGHTDDRGADDYNQQLSEARAASVMNYLKDKGLDAARLEARGFGETQPVASNETADGRAKNRRIEFTVLEGGASQ
ncbi:MAG: OmpA family protein [Pseudomonadota bacterium]